MNFDTQQNDTRAQHDDIRILDDDELCHVQGGVNLFDLGKALINGLYNVLHMANGRPQV
jgi:hypothetical protein